MVTEQNGREDEDEAEIIYVPDDDGNDVAYEVYMWFEPEDGTDRKYVMLIPLEDDGEAEQEVLTYRYEEEDDRLKLIEIEDEAEWDMIEEVFNTFEVGVDEAEEDGR